MAETQFIPGLYAKAPHERAPEFIKCAVSIKRVQLMEWLAGHNEEWLNIDVKESRGGKWYCTLNTYQRRPTEPVKDCPQPEQGGGFEDDNPDSIPF